MLAPLDPPIWIRHSRIVPKPGDTVGVKREREERSASSESSMGGGPPDVSDLDGDGPAVDGDSSASSYSNDEQGFAMGDGKMF